VRAGLGSDRRDSEGGSRTLVGRVVARVLAGTALVLVAASALAVVWGGTARAGVPSRAPEVVVVRRGDSLWKLGGGTTEGVRAIVELNPGRFPTVKSWGLIHRPWPAAAQPVQRFRYGGGDQLGREQRPVDQHQRHRQVECRDAALR
jgi:hypothetical protein